MIDFIKRKKILLIILLIFFLVFIGIWNIVSVGYDKQNKTILFLKKIIPTSVSRKIRDIEYDYENNVLLIIFEHIPSLGVLKLN